MTASWTATSSAITPTPLGTPDFAEFLVSSTADLVDAHPGDGVCAASTGECTLRAAVMESNAVPGPAFVDLPPAAYPLTLQGSGGEDLAETGDLDVLDELYISGWGMTLTGVDASGLQDRVFHVHPGAILSLANVSLVNGNAGSGQPGGGLFNEAGITGIYASSVQFNQAESGAGLANTGSMSVDRSLIFGNSATDTGGGIRNEGTLEIERSTIAQNRATAGGGAIASSGAAEILNSTLASNISVSGPAAILNESAGTATINNTTIYANFAEPGGTAATGGISNIGPVGSVVLSNTILSLNADALGDSNCIGPIDSAGYNLFGTLVGCMLLAPGPGDLFGINNPMLDGFTANPDGTASHPPLPGSPGIDAGNPAPVGSGPPACEPFDQRFVARPQGAHCDIGSYEVESGLLTPTLTYTPTPTITPTIGPSRVWQVSGSIDSNFFGRSLSGGGDVNGDGYDDVMVGAPGHREYESGEGAVFIYLGGPAGPSTDADWQVQSNLPSASLGNAVDLAGDVNGDGFDDVLVGANNLASAGTGSGAVFAYYGGPSGPATSPDWSTYGQGAYELYGWSVAMAGDVNADGFGDVLVGAPQFTGGQSQEGKVSLYLGSASGPGLEPDWQIEGGQTEAGYGYAVAAAGDVNGDGYDDFLVSAYNYINNVRGSGPVYLYSGSAQGPSTTAAWIGEPTSAFDGYGRDISGAGDVNADGFADFLVGAPGQSGQIVGKAYLYLGSPSGPGSAPAWAGADGTISSLYGYNVAGDCDVNNDGYDDFAVGDQNFPQGGAVFYYLGGSSGPVPGATWNTRGTGAYSDALRSGGRVDDDGYCEFMVGAPMNGTGKAYLYFGFSPYPATPTVTPSPIPPPTSTWTSTPTPSLTPTATHTASPTLTPSPTALPSLLFTDGFESGDLSAWTSSLTDGGDLSVASAAAIGGSYGLQAVVDDNHSIYVVDDTPSAERVYRARFYFDPNGISMASGNAHIVFLARDVAGVVAFRIEFRSFQGDYQVRGVAPVDDAPAMATVWIPITDAIHLFEVAWWTASGEFSGDGGLLLWIDDSGEPLASFDGGLDNEARRVDSVRLGAVSGIDGGTRGTYFFDAFASTEGLPIGPDASIILPPSTPVPDAIFADGFESGDLAAWSAVKSNGGLMVTDVAALDGALGMEAAIDDTVPLYVTDWSPIAEGEYHARFVFDPNSLTMLDGRSHFIFQAIQGSAKVVARVEFRFKSGAYQLRAAAWDESGSWRNTSWWNIDDAPHVVELLWQAPAGYPVDGVMSLWLDGVEVESQEAIYSSGLQVDFVRLGAVAGLDNGTQGSMYFDAFESRRETYVGPPSGP